MEIVRLIPNLLIILFSSNIQKSSSYSHSSTVGCYFANWAQHRQGDAKFLPKDIDASLCTHAYFAFADILVGKLRPKPFESNDATQKGLYYQFVSLKRKNPNLKTLLSLGGATTGIQKFRDIANDDEKRIKFIKNSIKYLRKFHFDGIDIDWEYPKEEDKEQFSIFLSDYREALEEEARNSGKPRLLLTAAVAAWTPNVKKGYDVPEISKSLDFINIMAYDYHGVWNKETGHNAPLTPRSDQSGTQRTLNVEASVDGWIELGAKPEKLVLGLAAYGRTFTLSDESMTDMNSPISGAGDAGKYSGSAGMITYYEVCEKFGKTKKKDEDEEEEGEEEDDYSDEENNGWTIEWNDDQQVPYAYRGDQWIGYDNKESIRLKTNLVKSKGLGGAMIWTLDFDDFSGQFCDDGKYPILRTVDETLTDILPTEPPTIPILHDDFDNSSPSTSIVQFSLFIYFMSLSVIIIKFY
ncbi:hypothetical protein SNEBB_002045 [Seison nebaliae]|nr:hypothetical protein SNEBB_002045 [Seison nebaliae]